MTIRTEAELAGVFADGQAAGSITPSDVRDFVESVKSLSFDWKGWANYEDSQYAYNGGAGTPWQPTPGQWNNVPNDGLGAGTFTDQKPLDITGEMLTVGPSATITGRDGDGFSLELEFVGIPTTNIATTVECAIFIGNNRGPFADGRIYGYAINFPKGQNVPEIRTYPVSGGYMRSDFQANGGIVQFRPSNAVNIFSIRHVITRTHKGRS